MGRKPLGLFLAKDFSVASVPSGDSLVGKFFLRWVQSDPAYEVSIFLDRMRLVNALGEELCSFGIWTSKNDGEVSVVNPPMFPIYFGLYSCEPWIAKDSLMFT